MQREIPLFDNLFQATCKMGNKVRDGRWVNDTLSEKECVEICKNGSISVSANKRGEIYNKLKMVCY